MSRHVFILAAVTMIGASTLFSADLGQQSAATPKELLEKQLEAARSVFREDLMRLQSGEAIFDEKVLLWSERWRDAELALSEKSTDQVSALKLHLDRTKEVENLVKANARTGQGRTSDVHAAAYFRISAEIKLRNAISK